MFANRSFVNREVQKVSALDQLCLDIGSSVQIPASPCSVISPLSKVQTDELVITVARKILMRVEVGKKGEIRVSCALSRLPLFHLPVVWPLPDLPFFFFYLFSRIHKHDTLLLRLPTIISLVSGIGSWSLQLPFLPLTFIKIPPLLSEGSVGAWFFVLLLYEYFSFLCFCSWLTHKSANGISTCPDLHSSGDVPGNFQQDSSSQNRSSGNVVVPCFCFTYNAVPCTPYQAIQPSPPPFL